MVYIINDGCHSGKVYFSKNLYITCYILWQNSCICVVLPRFSRKLGYFSGSLPVLVTPDEALRRVYYMSAVSLLSVYRTGFPVQRRVYVSNTPESNCTMMYFWDTREWATAFALLDPATLKDCLRSWLARGITNGYAEEYLTGTLQGPWYIANDYSLFILLDDYLNVTGDVQVIIEQDGVRRMPAQQGRQGRQFAGKAPPDDIFQEHHRDAPGGPALSMLPTCGFREGRERRRRAPVVAKEEIDQRDSICVQLKNFSDFLPVRERAKIRFHLLPKILRAGIETGRYLVHLASFTRRTSGAHAAIFEDSPHTPRRAESVSQVLEHARGFNKWISALWPARNG